MKYHVEQSMHISTPLNKVMPLVEDFNHWNSWSPWTIVEPECEVTVSGTPGEIGHTMVWKGEIIGSGTNEISKKTETTLSYDLEFLAPFKTKAVTGFIFENVDGGTKVTWTMDSSMPAFLFFMTKLMKNWISMDYNRGLRMLKEVAEKGSVNAKTTNNGTVDIAGFSYVGIQRTVPFTDRGQEMKQDFEKIVSDVVKSRGKAAKHWVCLYPKMNMSTMTMTYIAAVSDEELKDEDLGSDYIRGEIKPTKALEIKHEGSYDFLGNAWSMGMMYIQSKRVKKNGWPFEQYWNNPMEVEPHELKTSIFFPIKG